MTEPHDITVRKVKFEFPDELDEVLPGNDVVRETYMVAFSLTMPYLEPYLIRTFRSVADDITDAGLAADVRSSSDRRRSTSRTIAGSTRSSSASSARRSPPSCRPSRIGSMPTTGGSTRRSRGGSISCTPRGSRR
jgi:hypothetical protein